MNRYEFVTFKVEIDDTLSNFWIFWGGFEKIVPPWHSNTKTGICVFAVMIDVVEYQFFENPLTKSQMDQPVNQEICFNTKTKSNKKSKINRDNLPVLPEPLELQPLSPCESLLPPTLSDAYDDEYAFAS